jgi:hypothetical protein
LELGLAKMGELIAPAVRSRMQGIATATTKLATWLAVTLLALTIIAGATALSELGHLLFT